MTDCPVCGMMVNEETSPSIRYQGKKYYFHKPEHKVMFKKDPEKFLSRQNSSNARH